MVSILHTFLKLYFFLFRDLMTKVENVMTGSGPLSLLPTLFPNPKIANLPIMKDLNGFDSFRKCMDAMDDLIKPYIEQHKKTFDPNDLRDFIDVYIAEMKATKNPDVRRSKRCTFFGELYKKCYLLYSSLISLVKKGISTCATF